jgi:hypothetical protein
MLISKSNFFIEEMEKIYKIIKKNKGITKSQLCRKTQNLNKYGRDMILIKLICDDKIKEKRINKHNTYYAR